MRLRNVRKYVYEQHGTVWKIAKRSTGTIIHTFSSNSRGKSDCYSYHELLLLLLLLSSLVVRRRNKIFFALTTSTITVTDCANAFWIVYAFKTICYQHFCFSADVAFVYSSLHRWYLCVSPHGKWANTIYPEWFCIVLENQRRSLLLPFWRWKTDADHAHHQYHAFTSSNIIIIVRNNIGKLVALNDDFFSRLEFNDCARGNFTMKMPFTWTTTRKIVIIMTCINFCFIYCYKLQLSNFLLRLCDALKTIWWFPISFRSFASLIHSFVIFFLRLDFISNDRKDHFQWQKEHLSVGLK